MDINTDIFKIETNHVLPSRGKVLTLEGLPGGQPFGNRVNIVLTHDMQYKVKGAVVCHSLEEALKALKDYDEGDIYIIGGESVYRQFLPYCIFIV